MCMRDTKPSEKVPYELDGEPCSLYKLVVAEPGWAAARINYSVDRIAELEQELALMKSVRPSQQEIDYKDIIIASMTADLLKPSTDEQGK